MQPYDLSTLPTGERVITEHVPNVRSVSFGFWIGTGSRDETDARAGRLALHRAPALQGHEHALRAGDRGDLRRPRRRAERRHLARDDARLRARAGRPARAGARRDGRDGLRPRLRRDRLRARGRARGDRDGRRQPAGSRPRRGRRGGLRRPPARTARDRPRRGDLERQQEGARPRTTGRRTRPTTSSSRRPATSRTTACVELLSARLPATADARRRARKPFGRVPPPGYRFQRKATEQYHVCLGAPGISRRDERRFAASLLDSILGGSASSRLFQEIREKRGMAYSVYSFASQYSDSGQIGLYVGTREENLVECFEIVARELARRRGRERPAGRARAREGEPEGPDAALARVDVEPDEPARQVADHRHGAAHARRARRRRSRRSRPTTSRRWPPTCSGSTGSPPRGSALASRASGPRSSASTRRSWSARPREGHPLRPQGQGRLGARAGARGGRARARRVDRTTPTSPSTSRGRRRSRRTSGSRSRTASRS